METILSVRDAHKRFGGTQALAGAKLDLRRGEWLALLGPNGAGKTTLIRAIAGRVRLDAGEVSLDGRPLDGAATSALRSRLGVVPQEYAIYPLLTARENLEVFGELSGVAPAALRERVEWALDWTGLRDRSQERVRNFSGGMKRRLNFACGVLHKPDIILLDEPTVGVDPQSRERIWEMCRALQAEGASLLLTTHQLDEAERICERIVIIDHGRAIAEGTFPELVRATVGARRKVTLTLNRTLAPATGLEGIEIDGLHACARIDDVARELPPLLSRVAAAGGDVTDLHIEAPSLQAVFLHLTGRELRE